MNNSSKSQQRRKAESGAGKKPATKESVYTFSKDGMKVEAKNYADALGKRNKMIGSAPKSKVVEAVEKVEE